MNVGGDSEHSGGPGPGMGSPPLCQASPLRLAWFNEKRRMNKSQFRWVRGMEKKKGNCLITGLNCYQTSVLKGQLFQRCRPLGRPWSRMPLTVWSWSEPADPVLWSVPGSGLSRPAHERSESPTNPNTKKVVKKTKKTTNSWLLSAHHTEKHCRFIFLYLNLKKVHFVNLLASSPVWRPGCAVWQVQHKQLSFQIRFLLGPADPSLPGPKEWLSPGSEWAGTSPDPQPPSVGTVTKLDVFNSSSSSQNNPIVIIQKHPTSLDLILLFSQWGKSIWQSLFLSLSLQSLASASTIRINKICHNF